MIMIMGCGYLVIAAFWAGLGVFIKKPTRFDYLITITALVGLEVISAIQQFM